MLVITPAALFYVALTDFKEFKICNEHIFVLAGLFACICCPARRLVELATQVFGCPNAFFRLHKNVRAALVTPPYGNWD
jgi:hypothetical protein